MSIQKQVNSEQGCPLVMSNGRREASPRRLMSVVAEDDEEATEQQPVPRTRSPRLAKACLQEGADGPTVKTSLLSKSPNLEHTSRPSKHAGWKTSKFFSRSMASGELLRGFKKLSFSSSGEDLERSQTESKQNKGRLGSLRKRPTTSDEIAMANDVTSSGSAENEKKKEKGIVCKKDDIFSIIASVQQSPAASPATRRMPLRYTKSASFDPTPSDPTSVYETSVPLMPKVDSEKGESKPKSTNDSAEAESDNVANEDVFECIDEDVIPEEESKVQWDDSNVVDAMLLGGAIEAFLKGSMGVGNVEKRVSFKKP